MSLACKGPNVDPKRTLPKTYSKRTPWSSNIKTRVHLKGLGLGTWLGDHRERERRTAAVLGLGLILRVIFVGGNLRRNFGEGP